MEIISILPMLNRGNKSNKIKTNKKSMNMINYRKTLNKITNKT
jgi:hypothetical protein